MQRLVIRGTYLAVLSLLFVWYSMGDRDAQRYVLRARLRDTSDLMRATELVLAHIAERLPSGQLLCVWRQWDDGRTHACVRDDSGYLQLEVPDEELHSVLDETPDTPFLFDPSNRRLLIWRPREAALKRCPAAVSRFLDRRDMTQGLAIPISSDGLDCVVFAQAEVWVDDLATGVQLAEDIAFMYEQATVNALTQETAAARTRLAVARDLHDSVAQLLAGVSFRLEALKRKGRSAKEMAAELETLQAELATEQDHVRALIAGMRQPARGSTVDDAPARLHALTERLARQWGVECSFAHSGDFPPDAALLDKEIQQMIREGVANAVRHGAADQVSIALRAESGGYELSISDNGSGLARDDAGNPLKPRSLHERALALGGTLVAEGGEGGSTIRVTLPPEAGR